MATEVKERSVPKPVFTDAGAGGEPHLEILWEEDEPLDAVIEYVWGFPHGESEFVTVVVPELFRRPSLVDAVVRRPTFTLKRGLLR